MQEVPEGSMADAFPAQNFILQKYTAARFLIDRMSPAGYQYIKAMPLIVHKYVIIQLLQRL